MGALFYTLAKDLTSVQIIRTHLGAVLPEQLLELQPRDAHGPHAVRRRAPLPQRRDPRQRARARADVGGSGLLRGVLQGEGRADLGRDLNIRK
jgi:hypothetical protein